MVPPALRLPEIVHAVLQHLRDDTVSLFAAIRVSRTWFGNGVGVLWSRPGYAALRRVAPERRQFYADKITTIMTTQEQIPCATLRFPRLRVLDVWLKHDDAQDGRRIQLIQPDLIDLRAPLTAAVLKRLMSACPHQLRKLSLYGDVENYGYAECLETFVDWLI
jgi:hypothetical protein